MRSNTQFDVPRASNIWLLECKLLRLAMIIDTTFDYLVVLFRYFEHVSELPLIALVASSESVTVYFVEKIILILLQRVVFHAR